MSTSPPSSSTRDFAFRSRHNVPYLRSVLDSADKARATQTSALDLAVFIKRIRPELDLYFVSNGRVEEVFENDKAKVLKRIFYAVEELLELHLSVLEGVQDRFRRRSSTT